MDKNVMHNLIHREAGNNCKYCPVCNGEIKDGDMEAMEKHCNDILARHQTMGGPSMYSEKNKTAGLKVGKDVLAHPVYAFGEKVDTLPTEIMLVPIGKWNTTKYGEVEVTKEMIAEMKQHFDDDTRKGVMIDIDHGQSQYGDAAAGWIKKVECRADGLWATQLEWTVLGEEQVKGKMYRFLSPEFDTVYIDPMDANKMLDNVLIATSLVNRPLLRNIPALSFSEDDKKLTENKMGVMLFIDSQVIDSQNNPKMEKTLAEILAIAKDQRSAEEVQFVTDHQAEMTDEQKAAEGIEVTPATPPADVNISAKEGKVTMSEDEYSELKKNAEQGKMAFAELEAKKINEEFKAYEFSDKGGKYAPVVTPKVVAFATKLSPAMRVEFGEIIKELPEKNLFGEAGHDKDANVIPAGNKQLSEDIKKYAVENKMSFTEALKSMKKADPAKFADYETSKGSN